MREKLSRVDVEFEWICSRGKHAVFSQSRDFKHGRLASLKGAPSFSSLFISYKID